MRINAARGIEARAWAAGDPARVQIALGVIRATATVDEARAFAEALLIAAVEAAQGESRASR